MLHSHRIPLCNPNVLCYSWHVLTMMAERGVRSLKNPTALISLDAKLLPAVGFYSMRVRAADLFARLRACAYFQVLWPPTSFPPTVPGMPQAYTSRFPGQMFNSEQC